MFQIEYVPQRREIWDWYRRAWFRQLWKFHAIWVVGVIAVFVLLDGGSVNVGLTIAITGIVVMVLYPQVMFKPQQRTIIVDEDGLRTTIGHRSRMYSWDEFSSITEDDVLIITLRNLHAFVIPPRAFASAQSRSDFFMFVKSHLTE